MSTLELAAYELLRRIAERGGNEAVAAMTVRIGPEQRAIADRIAQHWQQAVDASLHDEHADDLGEEIVKYLRDTHALEAQSL